VKEIYVQNTDFTKIFLLFWIQIPSFCLLAEGNMSRNINIISMTTNFRMETATVDFLFPFSDGL
jgi:hypothetical protein